MRDEIDRVHRWRVRAAEIRAMAKDFFSRSAKQTMENVACTWEWLADDQDHRLKRRNARRT